MVGQEHDGKESPLLLVLKWLLGLVDPTRHHREGGKEEEDGCLARSHCYYVYNISKRTHYYYIIRGKYGNYKMNMDQENRRKDDKHFFITHVSFTITRTNLGRISKWFHITNCD